MGYGIEIPSREAIIFDWSSASADGFLERYSPCILLTGDEKIDERALKRMCLADGCLRQPPADGGRFRVPQALQQRSHAPSSFAWRFKLILKKNGLPEKLNVHRFWITPTQ